MADLILLVGAPLVAWAVTARWSKDLPQLAPRRRLNYRGLQIPTACGIAVVGGLMAGLAIVGLADLLARGSLVERAARGAPSFAAAAAGFALLGLWDDIAGGEQVRGWRGHLASLRAGTPSSGAVKLVGGVLFAFVLTAGDGLLATILAAGVLAGSANLFNLLDLRPGRALKFWLALSLPLVIALAVTGRSGAALCVLIAGAACIAFLPHDLGERAMLGDVGANAIGALMGVGVVALGEQIVSAVVLVVLLAAHAAGDKPGLSKVIDAVPPLRAFDRAGRAQA